MPTDQVVLQRVKKLAGQFAQTYPVRDERHEFPHEEMAQLKASGLFAAPVPQEYGGMGLPCRDVVEVVKTLAEGNPSIAQMFAFHYLLGTLFIDDFATTAQKQHLFGAIVHQQAFLANASAERDSKHAYA